MTDRYASVHLEVDPHRVDSAIAANASEVVERPFDVLLVGDFSARGARTAPPAEPWDLHPIRIDRDDFDAVLARLSPCIRLALQEGAPELEIQFRSIDDFHPDSLYEQAPLFARLRALRKRALQPRELGAVAAELGQQEPRGEAASTPSGAPGTASGGGVLDLILDEAVPPPTEAFVEAALDPARELTEIVRRLIAPHLVPGPDPRQADVLSAIDTTLTQGMRSLLHHPVFQATESLWRALFLLVRRVETDELLRLHIVDATDAEVEAALGDGDGARALLAVASGQARPPGEAGSAAPRLHPALVAVLRPFNDPRRDPGLLERLAEAARELGSPCVVEVSPELVGIESVASIGDPHRWGDPPEQWAKLRASPAARFLGAALPRLLLRMPYGGDGDECERFAFEELSPDSDDDAHLWGSPAVACAMVLAQSFRADGGHMRPPAHREIDGLPLPLTRVDGEVTLRQPAEAVLSERAAEALLERGVVPLVPVLDRGAVRILRIQSIAEPLAPLAGRWSAT